LVEETRRERRVPSLAASDDVADREEVKTAKVEIANGSGSTIELGRKALEVNVAIQIVAHLIGLRADVRDDIADHRMLGAADTMIVEDDEAVTLVPVRRRINDVRYSVRRCTRLENVCKRRRGAIGLAIVDDEEANGLAERRVRTRRVDDEAHHQPDELNASAETLKDRRPLNEAIEQSKLRSCIGRQHDRRDVSALVGL